MKNNMTDKTLPDIIWLRDRYPDIAGRHRENGTDCEPSAAHMAAAAFSDAERYEMQEYSSVTAADQKLNLRPTKPIASEPDTTYSPFAVPDSDIVFGVETLPGADPDEEAAGLQAYGSGENAENAGAGLLDTDNADAGSMGEDYTEDAESGRGEKRAVWRYNAVLMAAIGFLFNLICVCMYVQGDLNSDAIRSDYSTALGRCLVALCGAGTVTFAVLMLTRKVSYSMLFPIAALAVALSVLALAGRVNREAKKLEKISEYDEPFYYGEDYSDGFWWNGQFYYYGDDYYLDDDGYMHITERSPVVGNDWHEEYSRDRYIRAIVLAAAAGLACLFFLVYLRRRKVLWLMIGALCGAGFGIAGMTHFEEAFPNLFVNLFSVWNLVWFGVTAALFAHAFPRLQKPKENAVNSAN